MQLHPLPEGAVPLTPLETLRSAAWQVTIAVMFAAVAIGLAVVATLFPQAWIIVVACIWSPSLLASAAYVLWVLMPEDCVQHTYWYEQWVLRQAGYDI